MDTLFAPTPLSAGARGRPKSPERLRVEAYLRANADQAFTIDQVASALGLDTIRTRQHVHNACHRDRAHCTGKVGTSSTSAGTYKHGPAPARAAPAIGAATPIRYTTTPSQSTTEHAVEAARPGALRAFTLPSLVNGMRVERKAPVAMASTVQPRTLGK